MSKYDTIIWDMDGTLLDTLDDLADSVNAALSEFGQHLRTRLEIRSFIGNGVMRLVELSVPNGKDHPRFGEIFSFFQSHYAKNCLNKTRPYEGLDKILKELKNKDFRMAIVSNKVDSALKELAELYFSDTISITIGDSESFRRKPYPDKVFEAMRLMDAKRDSTVYIGDTEVDIATAKNAGIDCICVSWGYRDRQELEAEGAEVVVHTPKELAELLK